MVFMYDPINNIKGMGEVFKWLSGCDGIGLLVLFGLEVLIFAICTATVMNLHIYSSVSFGHIVPKYRRIVSVMVFILISVLSVFLCISVLGPILDKIGICCTEDWSWKKDVYNSMIQTGVVILGEIIYGAVMFFFVRFVLKNKLNLE